MRTVHDQRTTALFKPLVLMVTNHPSGVVANGYRAYLAFRRDADVMQRNARIDDGFIVPIEIKSVDVFSAGINMLRIPCFNTVMPHIAVAKIPRSHKREGGHTQIEMEPDADRAPIIDQSNA